MWASSQHRTTSVVHPPMNEPPYCGSSTSLPAVFVTIIGPSISTSRAAAGAGAADDAGAAAGAAVGAGAAASGCAGADAGAGAAPDPGAAVGAGAAASGCEGDEAGPDSDPLHDAAATARAPTRAIVNSVFIKCCSLIIKFLREQSLPSAWTFREHFSSEPHVVARRFRPR